MRKYKLKELRELVRLGVAENYTNQPSEYIYTLRRLEKVGYSTGIYGINGGGKSWWDTQPVETEKPKAADMTPAESLKAMYNRHAANNMNY